MTTNGHDHGRSAIVLYGTETGTSQDLAEEVGRSLERLRFDVVIAGCDDASLQDLRSYKLTVLLISTTGQGDFPDNARTLWTSLLRKKLSPTTFAGVNYAMVGLCDSSYLKFNWAARKLEKRLQQLGAKQIIESCEADEQDDDGTDGVFLAWLDQFRVAVLAQFPLPAGTEPIANSDELPSKWILQRADGQSEQVNGNSNVKLKTSSMLPDSFPATLEINDRVTPTSHWQDVRLLRLQTPIRMSYLPGDALAIIPENMPKDIHSIIDLMDWYSIADTPLTIHSATSQTHVNRLKAPPIALQPDHDQITLRQLLTKHLDINAIPRRSFFTAIAKYTDDAMHKERLLEFTDPQYLDEYYDYATRPRRSIIEILQEFNTVKIPWQEAINVFPLLRPRQFSIASGGTLKASNSGETTFDLLIAIVKYKTVIKRIREGVCTRWLAQLPVGTTLNVALRTEGRFAASTQEITQRNHLLIGAGTGIAPLRALIHEKAYHLPLSPAVSTTLVFGARNESADFFFKNEWQDLSTPSSTPSDSKGALALNLISAFSRDQKQKVYVQDRIREHAVYLRPLLLDENTVVIVCGASGQMPKAVRTALVDVLSGKTAETSNGVSASDEMDTGGKGVLEVNGGRGPMGLDKAEEYIKRLEKEGRYKQETWS